MSSTSSLLDALDSGTLAGVRSLLGGLNCGEIAQVLESSPPRERDILWQLVDSELEGEVLQRLSEEVRSYLLARMDTAEVAALTEGWDVDDLADVLQRLPDRVTAEVLEMMSTMDRQRVASSLTYAEDSAGRLMSTDTITVRPDLTVEVVLRYLRRHDALPEITDSLFVVTRDNLYIGRLPLRVLLTAAPNEAVTQLMEQDEHPILADTAKSEVALLFEREDLVSAAVVDAERQLLGRITIDDVVDVIRDDADHSLMSLAGLNEAEETFMPIWNAAPRRLMWLGINLLTALAASTVIGQFQETLDKVIALAVLMPIVASMGGVAGTQTLTVVIRGMALGQIERNNLGWLVNREVLLGAMNGMVWAGAVAAIAGLWFGDATISFIIAAAMVINLVVAALAGVLLPIGLRALNIDPALAGGVALTTVTDIVGFLAFLGLATVFYG
ncbi:MAG: magnesium transporter [Cellvibrionales bacterium]|nr:magnesium transporter [Cellvibrionales bacterium]